MQAELCDCTRGDLLDRAIVITLPPIPDEIRKDEATFWRDFETAHPRILGAFLDAVVMGLARLPQVHLERKPRMADFALWGVATEPACPWPEPAFQTIYNSNRQDAIEDTLDGDHLVDAVKLLSERWCGTATELLCVLNERAPDSIKTKRDWFTKPRQLSDALRRLAPALRGIEIDLRFTREARTGRRLITIEKLSTSASPASPASYTTDGQRYSGDESGGDVRQSPQSASPTNINKNVLRDARDAGGAAQPGFPRNPND